MTPYFVPIVEGQGEVLAVPALLRRIARACHPSCFPRVNPPIRIKSGSFLNDSTYFAKYIHLAAAKAVFNQGIVFVLLDSEDDCPAQLGPVLLDRAKAVRGDVAYLVALAHREYETWFLAAASSLGGFDGLPESLAAPDDPETIRGAKEWLKERMPHGYDPVRHQTAFTEVFDLEAARAIPSFERLRKKLSVYFGSS